MFYKNIKLILIITMLLAMVSSSIVLYADCDKMALIAKEGYLISNINDPDGDTENDFDDPVDFFDYIRERSCEEGDDAIEVEYLGDEIKVNRDGYGFIYYKESSLNVPCNPFNFYTSTNQAWYSMGQDIFYYRGLEYDYENFEYNIYNEPLDITESLIMNNVNHSDDYPDLIDNNDCEAAILLGHARQGSTGEGNHSFRFEWNERTYTFMHNGWIYTYKENLFHFLEDLEPDWFVEHNLNWIDSGSNWYNPPNDPPGTNPDYHVISETIDSEIFFHYLMKFIIDNDGDVIAGINQAVTQNNIDGVDIEDKIRTPDLYGGYWRDVVNFVLSDGENLYVFRNSPSVDSYHELSYNDNNNFYSVKTLDPEGGVLIDQFDLVKISRDTDPIEYPNFLDIDIKTFASGVTWTSCPRLTVQGTYNNEIFEQAYWNPLEQTPGLLQLTSDGEPTIIEFETILGNRNGIDIDIQYYGDEFHDNDFDNMLFRHEGYKIEVAVGADPTVLIVDGNRLPVDHVIAESMASGGYHWLGFWIPRTQNMIESFGNFWQYVAKVKSEEWFYSPAIVQRGGDPTYPVAISAEGLTLEYGKAYLVLFNEAVEGFHWTDTGITVETEKKAEPENFTYTEKADYEAIDVFNIPPSVTEIGVFEDDVCVGAVVVEDTCAQILVYSDYANRDPIPFSFEIVTGRGFSTPVKDYQVLDWETGKFETKSIFSGRQDYSIIRFGDEEEPEDNTLSTPQLYGNYPNPFNPTTTISFSVTQNSDFVTLEIFNIKGQKVKTLYKGIAEEGKHSMIWEGKDTNNKLVSSGIYFYKLTTSNKELTRKMLMIK